jgi:uncharacterized membrane protein YciS (DUF1049 family)
MKYIFRALIFLGIVLIWGTAGASDHNTIDGLQIMLQVTIGVVMIGSGWIGLKVLNKIAEEKEERLRYSEYRKRLKVKHSRYRDYTTGKKGLSR